MEGDGGRGKQQRTLNTEQRKSGGEHAAREAICAEGTGGIEGIGVDEEGEDAGVDEDGAGDVVSLSTCTLFSNIHPEDKQKVKEVKTYPKP